VILLHTFQYHEASNDHGRVGHVMSESPMKLKLHAAEINEYNTIISSLIRDYFK
jgi:hypothetical protein